MNIEVLKPRLNPKNVLRTAFAGAVGLASFPGVVMAGGGPAEIRVDVSCSNRPAYGRVEIGPHAAIYVDARNLNALPGIGPDDGVWLYVGKSYAASGDPDEARGSRVVGFSDNPDSFTAYLDGFVNSIRGQDVVTDNEGNQEVQPIKFNPYDEIMITLRKGPYTDGLPVSTVPVAGVRFGVPNCADELDREIV